MACEMSAQRPVCTAQRRERKAALLLAALCGQLLLLLSGQPRGASAQLHAHLYGSGSTVTTAELSHLSYMMANSAKPPIWSAYRAIGTNSGRAEFMLGLTNQTVRPAYSVLGMPLPNGNWTAGNAAGLGKVLNVPFVVAKIGFFHTVLTANMQTQTLNLTACQLLGIYSGTITSWTDPSIKATNPYLSLAYPNAPITVLRRASLFSPSQYSVINFLASLQGCPTPWMLGTTPDIVWPPSFKAMSEDEDMLAALSTAGNNASTVLNAIGFIDIALGLLPQWALTEVALMWAPGATTYVPASATDTTLLTTAIESVRLPDIDSDYSTFLLQDALQASQAPLLWPVLMMPSVVVLQDTRWLANASTLLPAAFNMLLLSDAVQRTINTSRHVPLPLSVRQSLWQSISSMLILNSSAPTWSIEYLRSPMVGTGALDYVFSEYRVSGLALADITALEVNARLANITADLENARQVRSELAQTIQANNENQELVKKATEIAVAGVVLSVLLAFIALIIGAVHVAKLKSVDAKYAKYISLNRFTNSAPSSSGDAAF